MRVDSIKQFKDKSTRELTYQLVIEIPKYDWLEENFEQMLVKYVNDAISGLNQ